MQTLPPGTVSQRTKSAPEATENRQLFLDYRTMEMRSFLRRPRPARSTFLAIDA